MKETISSQNKVLFNQNQTNKVFSMGSRLRSLAKKIYILLDREVDLREQAIGWTAIGLTFLVCWNLLKFVSNHQEVIKNLLRSLGYGV